MNTVGSDQRLNYYQLSADEALAELKSHRMGLTNVEAERRLKANGWNLLHEPTAETFFQRFVRPLASPNIILLFAGAILSNYVGDGKTTIALVVAALLLAIASYLRELRPGLPALSNIRLLPAHAKVVRNGQARDVKPEELVIGDIVQITAGDIVPADVRLLEEYKLVTLDNILGLHSPSRKYAHALSGSLALTQQDNLAFMGTRVQSGHGQGVVTATGGQTELGRILALAHAIPKQKTSLQTSIAHYNLQLNKIAVLLAVLLAALTLFAGFNVKEASTLAIIGIVALASNGLAVSTLFALVQFARRARRNLVRVNHLSSIATVGISDVLLADETLLVDHNQASVSSLLIGRSVYSILGEGYDPTGKILDDSQRQLSKNALGDLSLFFTAAALSGNAKVCPPDASHDEWYAVGHPSEAAMLTLARRAGIHTESLELEYEEIRDFPLDASRGLATSLRKHGGEHFAFVMGTPEAVMMHSKKLWDHGHVRNFTAGDRAYMVDHIERDSEGSGHSIALAYRLLPRTMGVSAAAMHEVEQDLTILGVVTVTHPAREDIDDAMADLRNAHVSVSVLTSQRATRPSTLVALARQATPEVRVEIIDSGSLGLLSDAEVAGLLGVGGYVFSEVSGEDKLRLVEIATAAGHNVAMTGNSISDNPALLRSSASAIGIQTLDATADVILEDNNLERLVRLVRSGRRAVYNLSALAAAALTDNVGEISLLFLSALGQLYFHLPFAITAVQIVAINLLIQPWPIAALGRDKPPTKLMQERPAILTGLRLDVQLVAIFGILAGVIAYGNFWLFYPRHGLSPYFIDSTSLLNMQAIAVAAATLVFCQLLNLIFSRADHHENFWNSKPWRNKSLLAGCLATLAILLILLYAAPLQGFFGIVGLDVGDWLMVLLGSTIYLLVRMLQRQTRRHARRAVIQLHREVYGKGSRARI